MCGPGPGVIPEVPMTERVYLSTTIPYVNARPHQGLYCVGCELFVRESDLVAGRCPEHGTAPELVAERNWFFRLSRYAGRLHELVGSGRLRVEPAGRRNEVLAFISAGLEDFSISR